MVQGLFPVHFRQPADGVEVIFLDPGKVILTLHVQQTEDDIGVRFAVDMRDPVTVADDGDPLRLLLPTGNFGRGEGLGGSRKSGQEQKREE